MSSFSEQNSARRDVVKTWRDREGALMAAAPSRVRPSADRRHGLPPCQKAFWKQEARLARFASTTLWNYLVVLVHVEHDAARRTASMDHINPMAGKIGKPQQV